MVVPQFLNTLEQSGLSTWLRESESLFGFYFVLVFHTIGLALVVGPNAAIDLRLLGVAPDIPLPPRLSALEVVRGAIKKNGRASKMIRKSKPPETNGRRRVSR